MGDEQGQIVELLAQAALEIDAVGKSGRNHEQNYDFRAVDDVINATGPVLGRAGVVVTREILSIDRSEAVKTRSGGQMRVTLLHCRFTFTAPDGSSVQTDALGEGMDSGDKGASKAMSAAKKYALCHALLIPTEDRSDPEYDAPGTNPEADAAELKRRKIRLPGLVRLKRAESNITSDLKSMAVVVRIIRETLDSDEIADFVELEEVERAINSGEYDLATGERVPPDTNNPQGDLL